MVPPEQGRQKTAPGIPQRRPLARSVSAAHRSTHQASEAAWSAASGIPCGTRSDWPSARGARSSLPAPCATCPAPGRKGFGPHEPPVGSSDVARRSCARRCRMACSFPHTRAARASPGTAGCADDGAWGGRTPGRLTALAVGCNLRSWKRTRQLRWRCRCCPHRSWTPIRWGHIVISWRRLAG